MFFNFLFKILKMYNVLKKEFNKIKINEVEIINV